MALKQRLTKAEFEALPDATRELYKTNNVYIADGDNWKLDAEGVEDVTGLKSALQKERDAAKTAEAARKALEAKFKDVDPERYAQLVAEAETKETDELKSKGKIDEILEKHKLSLAKQKETYEGQIGALNKELDSVIIEAGLRASFEKAGVMADRIDDAVELTRSKAKRENGKLVLLDQDGTPLDVSLENYATEVLKDAKPWLYAASGNGGSGAPAGLSGAKGSGRVVSLTEQQAMTAHESTEFFKSGGKVAP